MGHVAPQNSRAGASEYPPASAAAPFAHALQRRRYANNAVAPAPERPPSRAPPDVERHQTTRPRASGNANPRTQPDHRDRCAPPHSGGASKDRDRSLASAPKEAEVPEVPPKASLALFLEVGGGELALAVDVLEVLEQVVHDPLDLSRVLLLWRAQR